jgi:pimeloyl-ACP methyl ester carboxylesterase
METIATLLRHLDRADASLLGFSYGGCVAVATAARRPELVRRLVLVGAYADGSAIAPARLHHAHEKGPLAADPWGPPRR